MKKIAIGVYILLLMLFLGLSIQLPYIVKEYTHSTIIGIIAFIITIIIYAIYFIFYHKKLKEFLGHFIFVQWVMNSEPDLSYMRKNKEKYQHRYSQKICIDFLNSTVNEIKNSDTSLSYAADDVKKIVSDNIYALPHIDSHIYKGQLRNRLVYRLLEKVCREKLLSGKLPKLPGILRPDVSEYMALWEMVAHNYALVEPKFAGRIGPLREDIREGISRVG